MCAILLDKLGIASLVVVTDGDDDTMKLMHSNMLETSSSDALLAEKLYWGKFSPSLQSFQARFPNRFDVLIAADVIYEELQVQPLIETVSQLLHNPDGEFILAFARRNVPIDKVLVAADAIGLQYVILDHGLHNTEPIYKFTWK